MRSRRPLYAALLVTLFQPLWARATTYYWDSFSTDWTAPGAWSTTNSISPPTISGGIPGVNDSAVFNASGVANAQTVFLSLAPTSIPTSVKSLLFNAPVPITISSGASSGSLQIGSGGLTVTPGTTGVTINTLLQLSSNQAWSVGSFLSIPAGISMGAFTLNLSTPNFWFYPNSITGTAAGGMFLSGGTITLSGNNTYAGNTIVNGGCFVNALSPQALGSGGGPTLVLPGSTINFNGQSSVAEVLTISGTGVGGVGAIINTDGAHNPATLTSSVFISGGTATVGGTSPLTLSGNVSAQDLVSVATLTKAGGGTLTLSGILNNPALAVSVSSGTVLLAKNSSGSVHAIGTGGLAIAPATTARLGGTGNDQIIDTAAVVNQGTFDLNGRSEAIDAFTGTGLLTNTTAFPTGNLSVGSNNATCTFDGTIQDGAGTVGLTKNGSGILVLTGTNSFTGQLTINNGTVIPANSQALGGSANSIYVGGTLDLHGVTIAPASMTLQGSLLNSGSPVTFAGSLSTFGTVTGSGDINLAGTLSNTLFNTGTGTLTISGTTSNTTLVINISAGTIILAKTGGAGVYAVSKLSMIGGTVQLAGSGGPQISSTGTLTINFGCTLDLNGQNFSTNSFSALFGGIITNSAPGTTSVVTLSQAASDFVALQDGAGTLACTAASFGTVSIHAFQTYTGRTSINSGTLSYAGSNQAPSLSAFTIAAGAVFELSGQNQSIGSLAGAGTVSTSSSNALLASGGDNTSTTFSGTLANTAGSLSLSKTGTGTLTLTGTSTLTGAISVTAGSLVLGSTAALGAPNALVIAPAATLDLGGASPGSALLTLQGTLLDSGILPATFTGNVNAATTATASLNGLAQITFTGGFNTTSGATTLLKSGLNTLAFAGTFNNANLSLTLNAGAALLGKTSSASVHALGGNLQVNSGASLYLAGTGGDQIADTSPLAINGTFDLNGRTETVGLMNLTGLLTNSSPAPAALTLGGLTSSNITGTVQSAAGGGAITLNKIGAGSIIFLGSTPLAADVNITTGPAVFFNTQRLRALSISAGASAQIHPVASAPYPITTVTSLSVAGTFDLTNGNLLLQSSASSFAADFAAVQAQLIIGHNGAGANNHWNSIGITSSAATQSGTELLGLALASGADYLAFHGPGALFEGQPVDAYSILVAFANVGDLTMDGKINIDDYLALDRGFISHATGYTHGDFNYDGTVDVKDYALIDRVYKNQSGSLADGEITLHAAQFGQDYLDALIPQTPVPEPAPLALLLAGVPLLALRGMSRRRRLSYHFRHAE